MHFQNHGLAAIAIALLGSSAFAQTTYPEVEPNSLKSEATAVSGIVAGDAITGTSTGTDATAGSSLSTTVDMFRVKTGALPLGIYRHRLVITTTGTAGHTGTIRAVNQTGTVGVGGTPGTIDQQYQASLTTTTPARFNQWYGFGKQEEIYYRVAGVATTTAPYAVTLSTTPIVPTAVAGSFNAGTVTVTTIGQTTLDTIVHLFDSNLDPVAFNDDEGPNGATPQSRIARCLAAGTYYVAVGTYRACWNLPAGADEDFVIDPLMDFPGSLCTDSAILTTQDWDFLVTDGTTSTPVSNTRPANTPFETSWYTFTVVPAAAPANDACASALAIGTGTITGNISGATNDGTATCDPGGLASKDVWYAFTNTTGNSSVLSLNTCGSSGIDTVVTVFSACGGLELACSDDCGGAPCGGPTSCVSVPLSAAQTVTIRVSDKGLGGSCFTMGVANGTLNDDCATPNVLPGPGVYAFDTTTATTGTQGQGITTGCFSAVAHDLWYTYAATTSGTVVVNTCSQTGPPSPSEDSKIAVYAGVGCPAGLGIACNDDNGGLCPAGALAYQTYVSFPSTCGTTYALQVGRFAEGTLAVYGTFTVTETGSACATPFTVLCSGDGTDAACPCTNPGSAGRGCENTAATGGGALSSSGIASISADTLVLHSTFAVPFGPGLYYEGSTTAAPGPFGVPFGNGLRCAGGATNRLEIRFADGTGAADSTVSLAAFGAAVAGNTYYYQQWYRDTGNVGSCTPGAGFNLSNAISLTWAP